MASHGVKRAATTEPRSEKQLQDEQAEIEQYKSLVELIELKIAAQEYTTEVLQLTSKLLTKNPEYYTIWNVRKRLLIHGLSSKSSDSSLPSKPSPNTSQTDTISPSVETSSSSTSNTSEALIKTPPVLGHQNPGQNGITLELIQKDLNFLFPLLKQWPKCYWIWNHRIWLLEQANERLDVTIARRLWQEELVLVGMMLVKDSRNFHGWRYRRIIVDQLESPALEGTSMVEAEFAYTTKMVNAHLSNFSAWHSRSKLIPRLLDERKADSKARRRFLDGEFDIMRNALWTDAHDQSLWFYYQFLMTTLTEAVGHATIVPNFSRGARVEYVTQQLVDLRDMLEGAEDCKWIYNALLQYTVAVCELDERKPDIDEQADLLAWLQELRTLDPLRAGRWDDLEDSLNSRGNNHFIDDE